MMDPPKRHGHGGQYHESHESHQLTVPFKIPFRPHGNIKLSNYRKTGI